MGVFDFFKGKKKVPEIESPAVEQKVVQSPFKESQRATNLTSGAEVPIDTNPPKSPKWWEEGQLTTYKSGQDMDTFVVPQEGGQGKAPEINVTGSYDKDRSISDEEGIIKPEVREGLFKRRVSTHELLNSDKSSGEKRG